MLYSMKELFLTLPQRYDFRVMPSGTVLLQPVDFPLERCAFAVVPQPFESPGTIGGILGRGSRLAGDFPDEGGFPCT
jgi:hypothetical protein